ncbi:MAG: radical SAM family heme chaperone HemW [Thiobacillaceae bacterium]
MPNSQPNIQSGSTAPLPLTLYIHLPWCLRKCPYCDFNSHAISTIPESDYIDALTCDLESALPQIWGRKIRSIFFGGGTPSLFSSEGLDRIIRMVRTLIPLDPFAEITLEANPGAIEGQKFREFPELGINRLSLGIQSFDDAKLQSIGRIHGGAEARLAAELAAQTFPNFNLDLIYGLPGQTVEEALADVKTACDFSPTHLSCYQLTLEPNTAFGHTPPRNLPDEDESCAMQENIENRLRAEGFDHYETSAFARNGRECGHNLNYWQFGDYLGIGAGAHSKLSFHDRILRQMRIKHPRHYMASALTARPVAEERTVGAADLPVEFMMNALRLTEGVEARLFIERTGLPLVLVQKPLLEARARGLMTRSELRLQPTLAGQRFLNDLLALFLAQ